ASTPTLRQKNQIYKNRSAKGIVAEKIKTVPKTNYSYWAIGILCFALFGGGMMQVICQM
ncbi:hypothetical protein BD408DRAFT_353346, partial [Parasitella parasitica]